MGRPASARPDLFEVMSPEETWLLGLLWADGGLVDTRTPWPRITLNTTDLELAEHARRISGATLSSRPASTPNRKPVHRVTIAGPPVSRVCELGFGPRKSLTVEWPTRVEHPAAFVRGVFDGDGHFMHVHHQKRWHYLWSGFVGSPAFIEALHDHLMLVLPCRSRKILSDSSGVRRLTYRHRDSLALGSYMYADGGPCLGRKRALWAEWF